MIYLLSNSAWRSSSHVIALNTSASLTEQTEGINLVNIAGGARYLKTVAADADTKLLAYLDTRNGLDANACFLGRADLALGHNVYGKAATTWTNAGTQTTLFSETPLASGDLIGPYSQDAFWTFTAATDQEALMLEFADGSGGAWSEVWGKVYFGNAFELADTGIINAQAQFSSAYQTIKHGRAYWAIEQHGTFLFAGLTGADIAALNLFLGLADRYQPFVLYDNKASVITSALWHCLLLTVTTEQIADDYYSLHLGAALLRHYGV